MLQLPEAQYFASSAEIAPAGHHWYLFDALEILYHVPPVVIFTINSYNVDILTLLKLVFLWSTDTARIDDNIILHGSGTSGDINHLRVDLLDVFRLLSLVHLKVILIDIYVISTTVNT